MTSKRGERPLPQDSVTPAVSSAELARNLAPLLDDDDRAVLAQTPLDDVDAEVVITTLANHWRAAGRREAEERADAAEARLRQQERQLREVAERLERNDKLKAEFVATMSHELRTPLNVVLGFASLLADKAFGDLNPSQEEACEKILESSERLAGLINDLLDVSRLEAGTLRFQFKPIDLAELMKVVCDDFAPIAVQRKLDLHLEVPAGPHIIAADDDRLRQVLAHLLDNALKFTESGGKVGMRLIDPAPGGAVAIEVWDTGIGIPDSARLHLFERFYQVDSSNTRLYGGTGLGLSLVKEFVERHGGRVALDSCMGKGSTFRLDLPRDPSTALDDQVLLY